MSDDPSRLSQQCADVTKLAFPLAPTADLPPDLLAAFNGAIHLATLANTIQKVCAWEHCNDPELSALAQADAEVVKAQVLNFNGQYNNVRAAILAVTNELNAVRDGPAQFGPLSAPNAHLAVLDFSRQVCWGVKNAADPVSWDRCLSDPEARTNPALIAQNFAEVCGRLKSIYLPDGKQIVAAVQWEAARAAQWRRTRPPTETQDPPIASEPEAMHTPNPHPGYATVYVTGAPKNFIDVNAGVGTPAQQYVTLDQMAASVNRDKKTLERRKARKGNPLPLPAVEGGGGKPDEWIWSEVRPWLEKEFARSLPERYPTLR
jgi:hypothetical protein